MAQNIVSQRFILCLKELKVNHIVKSDRDFSLRVNFTSQNLSQIVKGKRGVTIELVRNAVEVFGFNPQFLFLGSGDPIIKQAGSDLNGVLFSEIEYVEADTYQNYVNQVSKLQTSIKTPFIYKSAQSSQDVRLFEVHDDNLKPFVTAGDVLMCKKVPNERLERLLRDQYIYVIVTSECMFITRIENNLKLDGEIELLDVLSGQDSTTIVTQDELKEVWEITHIIKRWTRKMNIDSQTLDIQLGNIQLVLDENKGNLKDLNQTIEKLLKQVRDLTSQGR